MKDGFSPAILDFACKVDEGLAVIEEHTNDLMQLDRGFFDHDRLRDLAGINRVCR